MASYFGIPAWFQTSSMSKRLLKSVISSLGVFDTDTLDLDKLNVSWGSNSTIVYNDVGLMLKHVETLLQLPPAFGLVQGKASLLRLTIPVDFYKSPIVVEIEGVECHLRVETDRSAKTTTPHTNHDRKRKGSASRNQAEHSQAGGWDSGDIPTAFDMAKSFLQTEPEEDKAQLKAAIKSEAHDLAASVAESDDGSEEGEGTGVAISLPAFLANILQGIQDRLQVQVRGIMFNLDIDIPSESTRTTPTRCTDPVTLQLTIDDVDVEGVTRSLRDGPSSGQDSGRSALLKEGKRLILLSKIRGAIISEADLFSSLARSTAMSLLATQSDVSEPRHSPGRSQLSPGGSVVGESDSAISPSPSSFASMQHSLASLPIPARAISLQKSISASDNGRFDDAEDASSNISGSMHSDFGTDIDGNPSYLDQITQSLFSQDDDIDHWRPSSSGMQNSYGLEAANSPALTPRASRRFLPDDLRQSTLGPSSSPPLDSMLNSTILPELPLTRFSHQRVSQSQSLLPRDLDTQSASLNSSRTLGDRGEAAEAAGQNDRSNPTTPIGVDLAQSQLFSHEDAESMYMSAMSHASSTGRVPGSWDHSNSGSDEQSAAINPTSDETQRDTLDNLQHARDASPDSTSPILGRPFPEVESLSASAQSSSTPAPAKIRHGPALQQSSSSVSQDSSTSSEGYRMTKQVFNLDQIAIYLPPKVNTLDAVDPLLASTMYSSSVDAQEDISRSTTNLSIPGDFPSSVKTRRSPRILPSKVSQTLPLPIGDEKNCSIEIALGELDAQFDVSVGRMVYMLILKLQEALRQGRSKSSSVTSESHTQIPEIKVSAQQLSLKYLERLEGYLSPKGLRPYGEVPFKAPDADILLRMTLQGLDICRTNPDSSKQIKSCLSLKKFIFGYAQENIVSFDATRLLHASVRDCASEGIDVELNMVEEIERATRIDIKTLPLRVSIDLQRLDETFSWFGGLSSVLNLGSSIASNATITSSPVMRPKSRGVRFETSDELKDEPSSPGSKVNVRFEGIDLQLVGTECSVGVETSAVRIVNRDELLAVSVSRIKLSGPILRDSNDEPAITVDVFNLRFDFLQSPQDADIERLLRLITPSNAKYDKDDDILLDTLLRQREKAALLRVLVEDVQARLTNLDQLSYLPDLGEEVSRLSTVAKYLPDDDRPGLLSLITVRNLGAHVDMNQTVGTVQLKAKDIETAHIPLPSLVALSVGSMTAYRNGSEELLGPATEAELRPDSVRQPAIMARMIGDEMEPIVRVRFWNLKVEYRVSTLITLMSLSDVSPGGDLAAGLTASVATLTDRSRTKQKGKVVPRPGQVQSKPMTIDLNLKDCVLGLNPLGLPSKVLVVITDAQLSATMSSEQETSATANLGKASIMVIDNVAHLLPSSASTRPKRLSFDGGSGQVADLHSLGWVSVGYISSAKATACVSIDKDGESVLDIEIRDDLFVMESCADSSHTLMAALGKLAPPAPRSEKNKYQTVIPMADLLADVSDAFGTPAQTTFEFDEDFPEQVLENDEDEDDLDLDLESEDGNWTNLASANAAVAETRDGIPFDTFSEFEDSVQNEPFEIDENYFSPAPAMEAAHKWGSASKDYHKSTVKEVKRSPLKVRVRDVHIIWHLYDGYDWQHTRNVITKHVEDIQTKAAERWTRADRRPHEDDFEEEPAVIEDFLFNSIYIGIPNNRDPRELSAAISQNLYENATETESVTATQYSSSPSRPGIQRWPKSKKLRLGRSKHHKITFELQGVCLDLVTFLPDSGETQSSIDIRIRDLEVFDHVPTSTWRKFATYMHEAGGRQTGASMVHLEILNVKPVPHLAATDIILTVTVLPLRLHVDQDALDFIKRFFEFDPKDEVAAPSEPSDSPFFQKVTINKIPIKLDFKPHRIDYAGLRSGRTSEFMNFVTLEGADIILSRVILRGRFDHQLHEELNAIWTADVIGNQLPGVLSGISPFRSIVDVGAGFWELAGVPAREYNRKGRVARNIAEGVARATRNIGTHALKGGAKVAIGVGSGVQAIQETLSPSEARNDEDEEEQRKQISKYANQPVNFFQGLKRGATGFQRTLLVAGNTAISIPQEIAEQGTAAGVFKILGRRGPGIILGPIGGAAAATGQILMGAVNSADPQNLRRAEDKYKH